MNSLDFFLSRKYLIEKPIMQKSAQRREYYIKVSLRAGLTKRSAFSLFLRGKWENKMKSKPEEIFWISLTIPIISFIWCLLLIAAISVELSEENWSFVDPFVAAIHRPDLTASASAISGELTKSCVIEPRLSSLD